MKSLYCYFGLLDMHNIDTPGHMLYQLGLLDSIREEFDEPSFDFYSYYPNQLISDAELFPFPNDPLGKVFNKYKSDLFRIKENATLTSNTFESITTNIQEKKYNRLYLKARFRNLSTLKKKWTDAAEFETIIELASIIGYTKDQIIVLDTDLSLSDRFKEKYKDQITIKIPSIDFRGVSIPFIDDCSTVHVENPYNRKKEVVYYGNVNTSKYKSGNTKNPILLDSLSEINKHLDLTLMIKEADFNYYNGNINSNNISRSDRFAIWDKLCHSQLMLNVTKDKYVEEKFIPARVYEAAIFGMVPLSYRGDYISETFSFNDKYQLSELLLYFSESSSKDYLTAYHTFMSEFFN